MRIVRDVGQGDPGAGRGADPTHVGEGGGRGLPTDCAGVQVQVIHLDEVKTCHLGSWLRSKLQYT